MCGGMRKGTEWMRAAQMGKRVRDGLHLCVDCGMPTRDGVNGVHFCDCCRETYERNHRDGYEPRDLVTYLNDMNRAPACDDDTDLSMGVCGVSEGDVCLPAGMRLHNLNIAHNDRC